MERHEVQELHYITHRDHLGSIEREGILSHNEVDERGIETTSVANPSVQETRSKKTVGGRPLHDYVNLYFNARNLMLYDVLSFQQVPPALHDEICVLRVDDGVLDEEGAIIADGNAARGLTRFHPSPDGLAELNRGQVKTKYWDVDDPVERTERRAAVMSELLVPDEVPPQYIVGGYVCCQTALEALEAEEHGIPLTVNGHVFFNSGARSHG